MGKMMNAKDITKIVERYINEKDDYTTWLKKVDACVEKSAGVSYTELVDYRYADAYANGKSPEATAKAAIRNDKNS